MRAVLLLACFLAFACGQSEGTTVESAELELAVATGAPVVTAWAEFLLEGSPVEVRPLHGAPGTPAGALPTREQLRAAQKARLIALNGAGFESWSSQAALPPSRTRATTEGLEERFLKTEERTHAHGGQGEHTHPVIDGRTWLDPALEMAQVQHLAKLLEVEFASHAAKIQSRASIATVALLQSADSLISLRETLEASRVLGLAGHGYGYLARSWGGGLVELELDLGARLNPSDWNRVRALLKDEGGILLCHEEPSAALRGQLAEEMRLVCVTFPTGEAPSADWFAERARAREAMSDGVARLLALRAAE